ncbi:MAG: hypothetical protein LLF76_00370 [Planctomycetaceae bacterium]|nr:hypothetical protein [Planctomycetaceae bacterium]
MRKWIFILCLLCAILYFLPSAAANSEETHSVGWTVIRSEVDTADADPNAVERTKAYIQEHYASMLYVPKRETLRTVEAFRPVMHANYVQICFTCNDASATATATLYALRDPAGAISPLEPMGSYTLAAGGQVTDDERYIVDTVAEVTDVWEIKILDVAGADGVSKLEFDTRGYYGFLVLLTTISADDNISCYAAYY